MIRTKRVYDSAEPSDGARFLVDHLWPRGLKKEALHVEQWIKLASPSNRLRDWFGHEPAKWKEFQRRYFGIWLQANGKKKTPAEIKAWSDGVEADSPMKNPEKRAHFMENCSKLGLNPETSTTFDWLEADDRAGFPVACASC